MTKETKIELAIVIIVALIAGTWIGLKLRSPSPEPQTVITSNTSNLQPTENPPLQNTEPAPTIQEEKPPQAVENSDPQLEQVVAHARRLAAGGKLFEARAVLTPLIINAPESKLRKSIKAELDKLNASLFWSKHVKTPDSIIYTVQPGDILQRISSKHGGDGYSYELLKKINKITNARKIRVGQKIKIPKGSFSALIQKSQHRMIILLNGQYIKEYPIGTGAAISPTPEDSFKVDKNGKQKNPEWTAPDGNIYPYGHPKNILGTRWIGLAGKGDHIGYGIHGTSNPDSVGKSLSNGCIRMLTKDVEEVFGMLTPGDAVTIVQ